MASESYIIEPDLSEKDEVDSLPSIASSALDSDDDIDEAQEEWERSLEQLQMLLTMILIPFAGKYFGRKFAYWSELSLYPGPRKDTEDTGSYLSAELESADDGDRLGQVYGVDARRRDTVDKQEDVQGGRRCGGCCLIIRAGRSTGD